MGRKGGNFLSGKRLNGMCFLFVSVKAFLFSIVGVILDKTFLTVINNVEVLIMKRNCGSEGEREE